MQNQAGADAGILFLDGLADGLMLNAPALPQDVVLSTAFGVLQASSGAIHQNEYISCPGWPHAVRFANGDGANQGPHLASQRTENLSIMGCIVNGIGEMADADYGLHRVGANFIMLFKQKEMVKRNIPTEHALEELIELIKENGDWKEA